ncbi:N-acetylmuramic acid 6-phosphate etherase [Fusibacter sp. JL298sf-3]
MTNLSELVTENRNKKTMDLDGMSIEEVLHVMNEEDASVAKAVEKELGDIARAVKAVIEAFENEGRLIYVGAGTSGRLGLLDAVECPPTFGTPPEKVVGLIAGGDQAFLRAVEGAEDSEALGAEDLKKIELTRRDVVVGLAASGRTPYVIGGLNYARRLGCKTVGITCNKGSKVGAAADIPIEVVTGPEVLTGSTRLKAGTAQKMVVNMISTASMVGIGKAYQNLMVDVQQTNRKLKVRAENIVMQASEVDRETARKALEQAEGHVKLAILMLLLSCDAETAKAKLVKGKGHIKNALI